MNYFVQFLVGSLCLIAGGGIMVFTSLAVLKAGADADRRVDS